MRNDAFSPRAGSSSGSDGSPAERARINAALTLMSRLYERDRRQREPWGTNTADQMRAEQ